MIPAFGYLTLAIGFLLAIYGFIMSLWGIIRRSRASIESARLALLLIFPLVTVSLVALLILLLDNRFDVAYVYSVTSRDMPNYLKLTALWGGQSGSLLFWSWLLAGFSLVFSLRRWRQDYHLLPWSLLVVFLILGFFFSLNVLVEIPFERFWHLSDGGRVMAVFRPGGAWPLMPQDGQGLNPLLRHPGMIWHPPALYLGFVGFIIPFALAISTLATGRRDRRWLEISQPWVLVAWVFLTLGLVLGMRWAYDVLGWGGYWGWDPVEVSALMPWLSGTAFLHTALLQQRGRGFRRWNLALIILTFSLVLFGTFMTRSGVLSSVHSFAGSDIGTSMFIFTAVTTLGSAGLLIYRWGGQRSTFTLEFTFSREVLTIFSNLVLLSILMVCFLGVVYPIFSELLTGTQITVGPAWYERITGPLLLLLVFLMGVCPLAAFSGAKLMKMDRWVAILVPLSLLIPILIWIFGGIRNFYVLISLWVAGLAGLVILSQYIRGVFIGRQRGKKDWFSALVLPFQVNRRRFGGLLVHFGVVLISVGIIGIEGLQQETQVALNVGEGVSLGRFEFVYDGLENSVQPGNQEIVKAVLMVTRDGKPYGFLYPRRQIFYNMGMAVTQPAVKSNLARDIYAILVDGDAGPQGPATFRFFINPLISWLWIGTGVLTLGTIIAVWPSRKNKFSRPF